MDQTTLLTVFPAEKYRKFMSTLTLAEPPTPLLFNVNCECHFTKGWVKNLKYWQRCLHTQLFSVYDVQPLHVICAYQNSFSPYFPIV